MDTLARGVFSSLFGSPAGQNTASAISDSDTGDEKSAGKEDAAVAHSDSDTSRDSAIAASDSDTGGDEKLKMDTAIAASLGSSPSEGRPEAVSHHPSSPNQLVR
ncbi:hypothetical protein ElyMa_003608300 [Elysia marginata]|uniref:Uncharacterized protein n=1 Tax=Elysia marginata TaxID=1093978 RepID=A0AAV4ERT8_9GAST|nr:hypothetical protein ElyMa_003608300 [Elysia marginata]